jgi:hypothetical protein
MEENESKSNRGGYRPGSGNKYKWRHGETKPVRIPISIADEVVELAKAIDLGKRLVPDDNVTQSGDTRGSDEIARYQAELESLKALLPSRQKNIYKGCDRTSKKDSRVDGSALSMNT